MYIVLTVVAYVAFYVIACICGFLWMALTKLGMTSIGISMLALGGLIWVSAISLKMGKYPQHYKQVD
jgi:hypothetical protein